MKSFINNDALTMNVNPLSNTGSILLPNMVRDFTKTEVKKESAASTAAASTAKAEPNLILAIFAGLNAAVAAGWIWAEMNYLTEIHQSVFSIGVGAIIGAVIRELGKGNNKYFGLTAVFFSLLGCIIGSTLNVVAFLAIKSGLGYMEILISVKSDFVWSLISDNIVYPDFFAYFVMCIIAYKISFKSERDVSIYTKFQNRMAVPQKDALFSM